jgi:hypothetical protein
MVREISPLIQQNNVERVRIKNTTEGERLLNSVMREAENV